MKLIHFLLDTKDKRESIFGVFFLLLLFSEVIRNMLFLFPILNIPTLESLYDLIPYASFSFIGRIILSMYSLTDISLGIFISKLMSAFSFWTILSIVFSVYFMMSRYSSSVTRVCRRIAWINMFLSLLMYSGAVFFILQAIRLTTYETVLNQVQMVSMWGFIMHAIVGVILLIGLYSVIRFFVDALDYVAIEEEI